MRFSLRLCLCVLMTAVCAEPGLAQTALTWREVRDRFQATNPTLHAGQIGVAEARAQEITAFLRPNPTLILIADQIDPFDVGPSHGPFAYFLAVGSGSYLLERQHKRNLRLESAQKATKIAISSQADLERNLVFNLRMAFVQTLQEKAILQLAKENLAYYDHVLEVSRERYRVGAIARVDLDRLELTEDGTSPDVLALDAALAKLAAEEPSAAEVVKLRYFAGLTIAQAAAALDISVRTANRHWAYAKAWLYQQLSLPDDEAR